MTTVATRYGFNEPRNRYVQRPEDGLYKFFREWMNKYTEDDCFISYMSEMEAIFPAMERCGFLKIPKKQEDIDYLALSFRDHPNIELAGDFLSALYRLSGLRKVVLDFDEDLLIDGLGEGFGGLLINKGYAGTGLGAWSEGVTVNFGTANHVSAHGHKGLAINNGEDTGCFGSDAEGVVINNRKVRSISGEGIVVINGETGTISDMTPGVVICVKEPKEYEYFIQRPKKLLKPGDCSPELVRYVQEIETLSRRLLDAGEAETQAILGQLEPKKVREELYRLSGFNEDSS